MHSRPQQPDTDPSPSPRQRLRLDPGNPKADSAPAGVMAAMHLCRVAADSMDLAKVIAAKTPVVPKLLAILNNGTMGEEHGEGQWHVWGGRGGGEGPPCSFCPFTPLLSLTSKLFILFSVVVVLAQGPPHSPFPLLPL